MKHEAMAKRIAQAMHESWMSAQEKEDFDAKLVPKIKQMLETYTRKGCEPEQLEALTLQMIKLDQEPESGPD